MQRHLIAWLYGTLIVFSIIPLSAVEQDDMAELRRYQAIIAATTNSAGYQAEMLLAAQKAVQICGASTGDASQAIRVLMREEVSTGKFLSFLIASQNAASLHGDHLPEISRSVAVGFGRGMAAVIDLNSRYDFLTVEQYKDIQRLFDGGQTNAAREIAFDVFSKKLAAGANLLRGDWGRRCD